MNNGDYYKGSNKNNSRVISRVNNEKRAKFKGQIAVLKRNFRTANKN